MIDPIVQWAATNPWSVLPSERRKIGRRSIRLALTLCASFLAATLIGDRAALTVQTPNSTAPESRFLGAETCGLCHTEIVDKQKTAAMAKAMERSADSRILKDHPDLKFQSGKYNYRIRREGEKSVYTISDGASEVRVPLLYGFGQGKAGQTYVFEYDGAMYESRVSFYGEIKGLDITLGYAHETPQTLIEAAGRKMSVDETRRCFGCHTTGFAAKTPGLATSQLDQLTPGVHCEACHGPGEKHVAAIRAGDKAPGKIKKLAELDGDDVTQNLCGACHRSVEDVMALPSRGGVSNVRFQPYRIFNSRCYSADKRIGCTACHDPHGPTQTSAAFYDSKCMACHQVKSEGKTASSNSAPRDDGRSSLSCPTGKADCARCHMPKIELPGAHSKFTDHRIRIVRNGAPYPF